MKVAWVQQQPVVNDQYVWPIQAPQVFWQCNAACDRPAIQRKNKPVRTARLIEPTESSREFGVAEMKEQPNCEELKVKSIEHIGDSVLIGMRRSNPCGFDIIPRGNFHGITFRKDKVVLIN